MRIAVLGWGSLVWDGQEEFDRWHEAPWLNDGPTIKLEFSRISKKSRPGALTLVIDPQRGSACQVAYCWSRRAARSDAIRDLKEREHTGTEFIGYIDRLEKRSHYHDDESCENIRNWAAGKDIDAVIWTDLRTNFEEEVGKPFSVAAAFAHLNTLDEGVRAMTIEYVRRAPDFVRTDFRTALQTESWFKLGA
jgi:hypothetical protein